jgi:hypothetical protein
MPKGSNVWHNGHMKVESSSPTKLLVRHAALKKFLSSTGKWTRRAETACNFPNLVNALHTCLQRGVIDAELIVRFKGEHRDRRLKVHVA